MVAAETYYGYLVNGRYEQFLQGREGMTDIPGSFREQLLTTYRQFMARQSEMHGGLKRVSALSAQCDSTSFERMDVFLLLEYADSVKEEIVVPMVGRDDVWLMK